MHGLLGFPAAGNADPCRRPKQRHSGLHGPFLSLPIERAGKIDLPDRATNPRRIAALARAAGRPPKSADRVSSRHARPSGKRHAACPGGRRRVEEDRSRSRFDGGVPMFLPIRTLRDPAVEVSNLERRINRLFGDALSNFDWQYRDNAGAAWVPPVDIFEEPDALRIMAEVPGVSPDNLKISLENNVLSIHGTKEQVAQERSERVHRYERTYGAFERSFTLPATVDANNIKASYEHGVLTLTLPKVEKAKPRQIEVKVASK
ncbi:MAG: hypothetical protein DMD36_05255 [Gemmatimonadetes bacterium]|nr:MAG: hypothetical protein DMD36_05255 [Gemmatimonadota bacterium]